MCSQTCRVSGIDGQSLNFIEAYSPFNLARALLKGSTGLQGSLGIPRNLRFFVFVGFFKYFRDFGSNIKVIGQNNMIFELLQQKPRRIMYKFRQNTIFRPETCEIRPKVGNRTCPDLPRPVQEDP